MWLPGASCNHMCRWSIFHDAPVFKATCWRIFQSVFYSICHDINSTLGKVCLVSAQRRNASWDIWWRGQWLEVCQCSGIPLQTLLKVSALPEYRPAAPHSKRWEPAVHLKLYTTSLQLHHSRHTYSLKLNVWMFSGVNSINSSFYCIMSSDPAMLTALGIKQWLPLKGLYMFV